MRGLQITHSASGSRHTKCAPTHTHTYNVLSLSLFLVQTTTEHCIDWWITVGPIHQLNPGCSVSDFFKVKSWKRTQTAKNLNVKRNLWLFKFYRYSDASLPSTNSTLPIWWPKLNFTAFRAVLKAFPTLSSVMEQPMYVKTQNDYKIHNFFVLILGRQKKKKKHILWQSCVNRVAIIINTLKLVHPFHTRRVLMPVARSGISGLPETWNTPNKLYGAILCFFFSSLGECCNSRDPETYKTSPNFASARGWVDYDWIVLFGWTSPLRSKRHVSP